MLSIVFSGGLFCTQHTTERGHPESPARYIVVEKALRLMNLWQAENSLPLRMASRQELGLCHKSAYIDLVWRECAWMQPRALRLLSTGDVVICRDSVTVARLATGAVLQAVDAVMQGFTKRAFCISRPPGHHAGKEVGMGFCLFNHVAVAARYAQRVHGIERVAIIDWDVHHGNGTQDIFYNDPSVFYFSTHQAGIYPGTGMAEECGSGKGVGMTYNVPIVAGPRSRFDVIKTFTDSLTQAMDIFRPQLILVSAGFDAHVCDPLGGLNLKTDDFTTLTEKIVALSDRWCSGKVVSVLEGGYHLEALAESACAHALALIA